MSRIQNSMPGNSTSSKPEQKAGERLQEHTQNLRDKAGEVVEEVRAMGGDAKQYAQERVGEIRDQAAQYMEQGRARASELSESLETRIREQPLKSALIAMGLGFLVGAIFTRR